MTTTTVDTSGTSGTGQSTPGTADRASNRDTTVTGGGGVDDPGNTPLSQLDTSGAQGGSTSGAETYSQGTVSKTLETDYLGSPQVHANPAYRAPVDYAQTATVRDTTLTDRPISNGLDRVDLNQNLTGTLDTVNFAFKYPATANVPVAPGAAPTVAGGPRGVTVTYALLADPAGAPVKGYVVENNAGGTDFAGHTQTSLVMETLQPDIAYTFRYAARNDNGTGPFSAWSLSAKSYNPEILTDPLNPGGVPVANRINPIYSPAGAVKAGTGGTTGPPQTVAAVAGSGAAGSLVVTWTAPAWGTPTNYVVTVYAVDGTTVLTISTVGAVLTATLTGLTAATAVKVRVVPTNARGTGVASALVAGTTHA